MLADSILKFIRVVSIVYLDQFILAFLCLTEAR
jgi:hypothetical protein